jgi:hypothetical protein
MRSFMSAASPPYRQADDGEDHAAGHQQANPAAINVPIVSTPSWDPVSR